MTYPGPEHLLVSGVFSYLLARCRTVAGFVIPATNHQRECRMADTNTNTDQDTTAEAEAPKPSDVPARETETDWKAEARKWEARAKANTAAAKQLEALTAQASAKDADLEELRAKVKAFEHDRQVEAWKKTVADDLGVPVSLLRGDSLEDITAHGKDIADALAPKASGPVVKNAASAPDPGRSELDEFRSRLFGN